MSQVQQALHAAAVEGNQQATQFLDDLAQKQYPQFVQQMCVEAANPERASAVRALAVMQVKNNISGLSEAADTQAKGKFRQLDKNTRTGVVTTALGLFADENKDVRKAAANVSATNTHSRPPTSVLLLCAR